MTARSIQPPIRIPRRGDWVGESQPWRYVSTARVPNSCAYQRTDCSKTACSSGSSSAGVRNAARSSGPRAACAVRAAFRNASRSRARFTGSPEPDFPSNSWASRRGHIESALRSRYGVTFGRSSRDPSSATRRGYVLAMPRSRNTAFWSLRARTVDGGPPTSDPFHPVLPDIPLLSPPWVTTRGPRLA
jgi:hypothetical protein